MAEYNKILAQFARLNYNESSQLQQHETDRIMDQITRSNTGAHEFDRQVSDQLWSHTEKQSPNTVFIRDYINTIIEAQKILKDQINSIQDELRYTKDEKKKQQLMGDLYSYSQDHRILTAPFNMEQIRDSALMQQSRTNHNTFNQSKMRESSGIFGYAPSSHESSWSLRILFILTVSLVLLELIIMFHKHHFYTLLCYCFVLAIFFLNYFDRTYIKFVMLNIVLSIILDLVWLIALAGHYWNPYAPTQHSTLQDGFLKFIVLFVIFVMAGRIFMLILLFRYRDNSEDLSKKVELGKLVFYLDAKPHNNPITAAMTGTRY